MDWNGNSTTENPWKSREFLWDKNYIRGEYNADNEVLKVKYGVFFTNTPNEKYYIDMIVGNELQICNQEMVFESFYMIGECEVDIEDGNMDGAYKLKNIIRDEDGEVLHKELLKVDVSGYESNFSWDDIIINEFTVGESNTMKISGGFYHDITELYDDYRIRFYEVDPQYGNRKVQGENLDLQYSTGSSVLKFDSVLKNIKGEGEEEFYYEILDNNSKAIGRGEFRYDFTIQEDSINWKKLEGEAYYYTNKNRLLIKTYLDGVNVKPQEQYTISIAIKGGGIRYSGELLYDDEKNQLYNIIEFRGKDKKYTFEYQVQSSQSRVIEEGVFKIKVDYKKKGFTDSITEKQSNNTSLELEEQKEEKTLSKVEIAINNFVKKQRKKYPDNKELIEQLEKTQLVLTMYAEKNTKYTSLVEEINSILQQKIDEIK